MPSRVAPKYIRDGLWSYDHDLDIVWDDRIIGWRFVYKGQPCDFILMHPDDTAIMELNHDETLRIAKQSDMHENYGAMLKRWRNQPGERAYARAQTAAKKRDELNGRVGDVSDHWRKRLDHAI